MDFEVRFAGKNQQLSNRRLDRAAIRLSPAKLRTLMRLSEYEMRRYFIAVSDEMHKKHGKAWPGGTTPDTLSRRSGRGLRSIRNFRVKGGSTGAEGQMRVTAHMWGHERARTIRAKRSKYLTIPLPAALNADGTPKYTSARQWQDTFVNKSKKGNLIIFQKRGRQAVPLYVLKKSVRIPARLGLRKELSKQRHVFRDGMMARIRELRGRRV